MSSEFFVFDIETAGTESIALMLSAAFVYVEPQLLSADNNEAYQQLLDSSIFVKFKAKPQTLPPYNRLVEKDTLDWWSKQGEFQRNLAIIPNKIDMDVLDGVSVLREFFFSKPNAKNLSIWTRGTFDQPIFESTLKSYKLPAFVPFNSFRDIRTAIDIIYCDTSRRGYVDVPNFDQSKVISHHPVHDCARDALMLLRGGKH